MLIKKPHPGSRKHTSKFIIKYPLMQLKFAGKTLKKRWVFLLVYTMGCHVVIFIQLVLPELHYKIFDAAPCPRLPWMTYGPDKRQDQGHNKPVSCKENDQISQSSSCNSDLSHSVTWEIHLCYKCWAFLFSSHCSLTGSQVQHKIDKRLRARQRPACSCLQMLPFQSRVVGAIFCCSEYWKP